MGHRAAARLTWRPLLQRGLTSTLFQSRDLSSSINISEPQSKMWENFLKELLLKNLASYFLTSLILWCQREGPIKRQSLTELSISSFATSMVLRVEMESLSWQQQRDQTLWMLLFLDLEGLTKLCTVTSLIQMKGTKFWMCIFKSSTLTERSIIFSWLSFHKKPKTLLLLISKV